MLLAAVVSVGMLFAPVNAVAQSELDYLKEGYLHISLGGGPEFFSSQFGSNPGGGFHLTGRHYFSDQIFGGVKTYVGLRSDKKDFYVPYEKKMVEFDQDLEEWAIMGGAGYDFWQNSTKRFCLYTDAYIGYGRRHCKQEDWNGESFPTTENTDRGFAAYGGVAIEYRTSANWLWGVEVGAITVAGHFGGMLTVSLGLIMM
ncbi:Uncharacterised protein [Prevotella disiens]|nr:Uncharacterised protein [Prevotella disiens]